MPLFEGPRLLQCRPLIHKPPFLTESIPGILKALQRRGFVNHGSPLRFGILVYSVSGGPAGVAAALPEACESGSTAPPAENPRGFNYPMIRYLGFG